MAKNVISAFNEKDVIRLVISLHDITGNYACHVGVLIVSILQNTHSRVIFYILHDETLTDANRKKFEDLICGYEYAHIKYVDVRTHKDCDDMSALDTASKGFTRGTLYRLLIPELLPDLDKVLYLDCDIVVTIDIQELWSVPLVAENYALGGVLLPDKKLSSEMPDMSINYKELRLSKNGICRERYINAGVLLMNLKKIRGESIKKAPLFVRALRYLETYSPALPDEMFLNAEYLGDIKYLPLKFNRAPADENYDEILNTKAVWHFRGLKPWNSFTGSAADVLYWKYIDATPWRDNLIERIFSVVINSKFYHRHSKDCINKLQGQMLDNLSHINPFSKRKDLI